MSIGSRLCLADQVFAGLTDCDVMERHFPMLLASGVPDVSVTVHSHFLTFLARIGQSLNYSAVTECPIWWAQPNGLGNVRADSVWFEKPNNNPTLAFEFERFERGDEKKLRGKVENLAVASLATPDLKLCVLVYWVRSGSTPRSMDAIVTTYRDGFRRRGHNVPPGRAPLMLVKCVMRPVVDSKRLVFGEFLRDERNERFALGRV